MSQNKAALEEAIRQDASVIYTNSTAMAAAMVALGFQFKLPRSIIRTFPPHRPKGTIGQFVFELQGFSPDWTCDTNALRREWVDRKADGKVKELIQRISQRASDGVLAACKNPADAKGALEEVQQLFVKFVELLPLAIMAHMSVAEENHDLIKKKMKQICADDTDLPWTRIEHTDGTVTMVPYGYPEDKLNQLLAVAVRGNKTRK
jgi:hypothetical protein